MNRCHRLHRAVTRTFLVSSLLAAVALNRAGAQSGNPEPNPEGDSGVLKAQVTTGGSYSPHSGNATRSVPDLQVPGARGDLDFVRHWNSVHGQGSAPFTGGGWTHSWHWELIDWNPEFIQEYDGAPIYYKITMIIGWPDGSTRKFWLTRDARHWDGDPNNWYQDPFGPAYPPAWESDPATADFLREMAPDGSEFWIYRADGGTVHFQRNPDGHYLATELFDSNGLRTGLEYEQGGYWIANPGYWSEPPRLKRVHGADGRTR